MKPIHANELLAGLTLARPVPITRRCDRQPPRYTRLRLCLLPGRAGGWA